MGMLETAEAWLHQQRETFLTRKVTYQRGVQTVQVPATVGKTEFEELDEDNVLLKTQSRDYLITAADLVLGGVQVEPQGGDLIIETVGGKTRTFEVLPDGGEPGWRWSDRSFAVRRVHTKLTREV